MASSGGDQSLSADSTAPAAKPKRVRTGCLTCRERHLKCDEALPICMNCRKSARQCRRGVRLNFIDTTCEAPPKEPEREEWRVDFRDESRTIASDYVGGEERYAALDATIVQMQNGLTLDANNVMPGAPALAHQALPSLSGMIASLEQTHDNHANFFDQAQNHNHVPQEMSSATSSYSHQSSYPSHHSQYGSVSSSAPLAEQNTDVKEMLDDADETLYMQVFVEEVGLWMDSMDSMKHFSRIMPFHALRHPMLLNAFLACGLRHLTLIDPTRFDDKRASQYYDISTTHLLRAMNNAGRDSVICATTSVILNVYEIMSEKALPRMNHIAGARALIKECGWDARSTGIGAACFWLNVGLETLSNMHFNWQSSWKPDDWQLDFDLSPETQIGREEIWTHRMLYITAKVSDFRATAPGSGRPDYLKQEEMLNEWLELRNLADTWFQNKPRTMHPLAQVEAHRHKKNSAFPEIYLIKRTTIMARLFYHTAMIILAQSNPNARMGMEMRELEQTHSRQICGIVAHVKDRGVASVACRCLHHAAECLESRKEQEEVLAIYANIHRETGWRIGSITAELKHKWGWDLRSSANDITTTLPTHADPHSHLTQEQKLILNGRASGFSARSSQYVAPPISPAQQHKRQYSDGGPEASPEALLARERKRRQMAPPGTVNPMFRQSDFTAASHVYQEHYVAPNPQLQHNHGLDGNFMLGAGLGGINSGSSGQHLSATGSYPFQHPYS